MSLRHSEPRGKNNSAPDAAGERVTAIDTECLISTHPEPRCFWCPIHCEEVLALMRPATPSRFVVV